MGGRRGLAGGGEAAYRLLQAHWSYFPGGQWWRGLLPVQLLWPAPRTEVPEAPEAGHIHPRGALGSGQLLLCLSSPLGRTRRTSRYLQPPAPQSGAFRTVTCASRSCWGRGHLPDQKGVEEREKHCMARAQPMQNSPVADSPVPSCPHQLPARVVISSGWASPLHVWAPRGGQNTAQHLHGESGTHLQKVIASRCMGEHTHGHFMFPSGCR